MRRQRNIELSGRRMLRVADYNIPFESMDFGQIVLYTRDGLKDPYSPQDGDVSRLGGALRARLREPKEL